MTNAHNDFAVVIHGKDGKAAFLAQQEIPAWSALTPRWQPKMDTTTDRDKAFRGSSVLAEMMVQAIHWNRFPGVAYATVAMPRRSV